MAQMNKGSKFGMILGGVGGIIAMGGLAYYYQSANEAVAPLGTLLLVAVMFFALSGAFSNNSQWTSKGLTFFAFLTAGVVAAITAVEYVDVLFGAVEVIVAALIILVSYTPATKNFLCKE